MDKVNFTRSVPKANEMYQAMDVFIFPSHYEVLGNVAIEDQASGLPTLCSVVVLFEAKVTNLTKFLPLGNIQIWYRELISLESRVKSDGYSRKDTYEEIVRARYDITAVAECLDKFFKV